MSLLTDAVRLSVIVCTHNPRTDYFDRCLTGLQSQTLPTSAWELLIIDNASTPGHIVAPDFTWHGRARVLREETIGLTPARLRGIREATGDLLVFVDDDNVLDADYLEAALRIADARPFLGSWSGQCRPAFEQPPPEWARRYWGNLVIREFESDLWSNLPLLPETMPCGAGLCVRQTVAAHYLLLHDSGKRTFQFDRAGDSLISGGDNDLAACACDLGLGMGLIASLRLTHLIPPERVSVGYLTRLIEGIYFSTVLLAHARGHQDRIASYAVRWHETLRACFSRSPDRQILIASLRGRRRALRYLTSQFDLQ